MTWEGTVRGYETGYVLLSIKVRTSHGGRSEMVGEFKRRSFKSFLRCTVVRVHSYVY